MSSVEQVAPPSFCIECDAAEGKCGHGGARYHESWFEYQTAPGSGKIRPEFEEWFHGNDHPQGDRPAPKPRSLAALSAEIDSWVDFTPRIGAQFREAYEREPLKLSRVAASVIEGAQNGTLKNPTSYLMHRLKEFRPDQ